jgi:anti-sigma factor RsiW
MTDENAFPLDPDAPAAEAELHAWLDGELPPHRRAAVERRLAENPEDAERLESWAAQGDLLRRGFEGLALAPLPGAAPAPAPTPLPSSRYSRAAPPVWLKIAAAVMLFAAGTASGWALRGPAGGGAPADAPRAMVADALTAHVVFAAEVRHPVEVPASDQAHLVAWLSRRLDAPLTAPVLAAEGFELMGGRLLPGDDGPAAQFMYQNGEGRRLTLYVRRSGDAGDTAFRLAREGAVSALYWKDRGLSWAVAGELDRAALDALARRVYAAFNS